MELRFRDFRLAHSERVLFENWNLSISLKSQGTNPNLGIMGPSGIGKTSLLRSLLEAPRSGGGQSEITPPAVTAYVPQEPVLFRGLTVEANASYFRHAGIHQARFDNRLFVALKDRLGLSSVMDNRNDPFTLSGGERQRLMLLRSLSIRPELLILDEPCSGMDLDVKQEFLYYLRNVAIDLGLSVIYVSHHWDEVQLICQQILYLTREGAHERPIEPLVMSANAFSAAPPTIGAYHAVAGLHSTVWPIISQDSGIGYQAEIRGEPSRSELILACRLFARTVHSPNERELRPTILRTSESGPYRICVVQPISTADEGHMGADWIGAGMVYRNQKACDRVAVHLKRESSGFRLCANSIS